MKNVNKNKTIKWIDELKSVNIIDIENDIKNANSPVRGIYGIFVEDICVYVGRAHSIYNRLFCGNGHISTLRNMYSNGIKSIEKSLPTTLFNAIIDEKRISIKILERVPLQLDNYSKDMQRLASAENKFIDYYQQKNQCLNQLPDGNNWKESKWILEHKKDINK